MDHCKDKKRHEWEGKYGVMKQCRVCGKARIISPYKSRIYRNRKGAFGKPAFA